MQDNLSSQVVAHPLVKAFFESVKPWNFVRLVPADDLRIQAVPGLLRVLPLATEISGRKPEIEIEMDVLLATQEPTIVSPFPFLSFGFVGFLFLFCGGGRFTLEGSFSVGLRRKGKEPTHFSSFLFSSFFSGGGGGVISVRETEN